MKSLKILLVIALLILPMIVFSQVGPGGVGTTEKDADEGDVIIGLWLKAGDLSQLLSDGDVVELWPDASGNEGEVVFPAGRTDLSAPVFRTGMIHDNPWVEFDGNGFLEVADNDVLDGSPGMGLFAVVKRSSTGKTHEILCKRKHWNWFSHLENLTAEECDHAYDLRFVSEEGKGDYLRANINANYPNNTEQVAMTDYLYADTTNSYIVDYVYNTNWGGVIRANGLTTAKPDAIGQHSFYPNPNENIMEAGVNNSSAPLYIGAAQLDPPGNKGTGDDDDPTATESGYFDGKMAEVIVFKGEMDSTEMIIVENYLAAEYNITLEEGNDRYDDTVCIHDLMAIGTEHGNDVHPVSQAGALTIEATENSADTAGDYLFVGHDGEEQIWVTEGLSEGLAKQWGRTYKLEKSGDLSANLIFNIRDANLTISDALLLRMIYKETYDAEWDTLSVPVTATRYDVTFELAGDEFVTGYYSIGEIAEVVESIHETVKRDLFTVMPNPSDGDIILQFGQPVRSGISVTIHDLSGRLVQTFSPSWENQLKGRLSLGHMERGIYLISVQIREKTSTQKLILD